MGLLDQVTGAVSQYANANPQHPPPNVESDFEEVCRSSSPESLAGGLSEAFRSHQTPPFGQMVAQLFSRSNPQQRTGLLSTLLSALGPAGLSQFSGRGGGIASLLGAFQGGGIGPAHAERISPQEVEELASHAERQNPSAVDQVSGFFAQHPGLVKTLGGGVLTTALSKIAQHGSGR